MIRNRPMRQPELVVHPGIPDDMVLQQTERIEIGILETGVEAAAALGGDMVHGMTPIAVGNNLGILL